MFLLYFIHWRVGVGELVHRQVDWIVTVRPYDHTTVQGATFNMHGQLYHGHANATALSSSPVVSALESKSDYPGSSPGWGKALCR